MAVAFSEGWLDVGAGHQLYYAEYGCPDAPAAVVLHGGPGSSCHSSMLDWFDLSRQRVVLFDQRGAGKSKPAGTLARNTTHDLVDDIERLRRFLLISNWLVVGGSWGAMLALMYSAAYPASVRGMVLRGVFLPGAQQMDWFFQGLRILLPIQWAELTAGMSPAERRGVLPALARRLLRGTPGEGQDAAMRWGRYETEIMGAMMGRAATPASDQPSQLEKYRLQAHYLSQGCFVSERQVFRAARNTAAPVIFVHGARDWICPPQNLARLLRFMPHAQARWVAAGTHTASDPAIRDALLAAIHDIQAKADLN